MTHLPGGKAKKQLITESPERLRPLELNIPGGGGRVKFLLKVVEVCLGPSLVTPPALAEVEGLFSGESKTLRVKLLEALGGIPTPVETEGGSAKLHSKYCDAPTHCRHSPPTMFK